MRTLQIPCIRDRVVQGALKLILEAIQHIIEKNRETCPRPTGYASCKTAEGNYEAVNYHRFSDSTVSGHSSKSGWAELALRRLWEQLNPLGVELNLEKTQMVNVLKGESFGFLGFDLRRIPNRNKNGFFVFMIPKNPARTTVKAKFAYC